MKCLYATALIRWALFLADGVRVIFDGETAVDDSTTEDGAGLWPRAKVLALIEEYQNFQDDPAKQAKTMVNAKFPGNLASADQIKNK